MRPVFAVASYRSVRYALAPAATLVLGLVPSAGHAEPTSVDEAAETLRSMEVAPGALADAPREVPPTEAIGWWRSLRVSGFVQAQYTANQLSEDQLRQGGEPMNEDRFEVRRARLRVDVERDGGIAQLEIDGNTVRGAAMSIRRANVGWVWRDAVTQDPLVRVRVGLTETPFGYELPRGQEELLFLERTLGSFSLFPGPTDTGARVDGVLGSFVYDVAIQNGLPIDDRGGEIRVDPTRAPDLSGRLGVDHVLVDVVRFEAGVSVLTGTGFSPGTDALKPTVEWRDLNENESLDSGELIAVPGRGAVPSYTFRRWATGVDASVRVRTGWGQLRVFGDVTLASNLDRGYFEADPIQAGADVRHLAWYVAALQEVGPWGWVGVRYDVFDPDSDLLDDRRGFRVPRDATVRTLSPIAGVRVPGVGRLMVQYDWIRDRLGRDASGVPVDLRNDVWTLRLQGVF